MRQAIKVLMILVMAAFAAAAADVDVATSTKATDDVAVDTNPASDSGVRRFRSLRKKTRTAGYFPVIAPKYARAGQAGIFISFLSARMKNCS